MRVFAFGAIAAIALAASTGGAAARAWTDPAGRVTFDAPAGWTVNQRNMPNMTYVIAGNADYECHVLAIPRAETASASVRAVRTAIGNDANFTAETWARAAAGINTVFTDGSATAVSHSSEQDGRFWPIQRAELQGTERLVHGAMQLRPGFEYMTFCQTYEGADPTATYDAFIRSIAHPNDSAWETQAAAEDQARQAQEAAQAAPAPPAEPQEQPRRR